jgi:hypothetical protein
VNKNELADTCGPAKNPTILGFYVCAVGEGLLHIEIAPGIGKSWEKRSAGALMDITAHRAEQYMDVVRADDSVVLKAEPPKPVVIEHGPTFTLPTRTEPDGEATNA